MVLFELCIEWQNGRPKQTIWSEDKFIGSAVDRVLGSFVSPVEYYIIHQGKRVDEQHEIVESETYYAVPRILGGKGGFGSMLRALGAQIEKTTNREACRDLSGRRMRDVNNEKKLREWAAKSTDREKDKQERRRERRERMLAPKKFKEVDKDYELERQKIADDLDDAFEQGLKKSAATVSSSSSSDAGCSSSVACASTSGKRKATKTAAEGNPKKAKLWPELHENASSSSDESVTEEETVVDTQPETTADEQFAQTENVVEHTVAEEAEDKPIDQEKPDFKQLGQALDLDHYNSAEELCKLGLDVLKEALMARGMKCGGTLKERGERLFSVKGIDVSNIPAALLAKPAKKK